MAEQETSDAEPKRWHIGPKVAVAGAVFVAAIAGLGIGKAATGKQSGPLTARDQAAAEARESATEEASRIAYREGYREGRRLGRRAGTKSGKRAGAADGKVRVKLEEVEAAESEAAAAQAALSEISAPPPAPRP